MPTALSMPPGRLRLGFAWSLARLHWTSGILILAGALLEHAELDWLGTLIFLAYPTCLLTGILYLLVTSRWPGGPTPEIPMARFFAWASTILLALAFGVILLYGHFLVD